MSIKFTIMSVLLLNQVHSLLALHVSEVPFMLSAGFYISVGNLVFYLGHTLMHCILLIKFLLNFTLGVISNM